MSIKARLLAPLFALLALSVLAVIWIGGSALYFSEAKNSVVGASFRASSEIEAARLAFERAAAVYDKVTAMTELVSHEEIEASFGDASTEMSARIATLQDIALTPEIADSAAQLSQATAEWAGGARVVLGLEAGETLPTVELMRRRAERMSMALSDAEAQVKNGATTEFARASDAFETSLLLSGIALAVLFAAVALLAGRSISRMGGTLAGMARAMSDLTNGKFEIQQFDADRQDELGEMARSIVAFRGALVEREQLEEKQKEVQRKRAARLESQEQFQERVRSVVDRAVEGDFAARIDLEGVHKDFKLFGQRVNALVEAVDQGVGATKRMLKAMAAADLTERMANAHNGAFGELRDDANATAEQLTRLIVEMGEAARMARRTTTQVDEGSRALAERGGAQAEALKNTAASMEEISNLVQASADNAGQANELAAAATERATRGKDVVLQAVGAVRRIEESSAKITEITGVIDGIAFQTNLLALNAAVEAARAGDAGKGFAVVASEVRELAQRCADAARDIKGLVGESSSNVEEGVRLVETTGASLDEIRDAVSQLAETISAASSAAERQSEGVSSVLGSVREIDEMTQRNAELARESEENGRALATAIARVDQLISGFRTEQEALSAAA